MSRQNGTQIEVLVQETSHQNAIGGKVLRRRTLGRAQSESEAPSLEKASSTSRCSSSGRTSFQGHLASPGIRSISAFEESAQIAEEVRGEIARASGTDLVKVDDVSRAGGRVPTPRPTMPIRRGRSACN